MNMKVQELIIEFPMLFAGASPPNCRWVRCSCYIKEMKIMDYDALKYNARYTFQADIYRFKVNGEYAASIDEELCKPAIDLCNVYYLEADNELRFVADRACMNYGKRLAKLGQLVPGETIQFNARITNLWINSPQAELKNPTKISIVKPLVKVRYPVPFSEKLRVGYVMEANGMTDGQPYSQQLVHQYDNWCDTYGYKKALWPTKATQGPTTIHQNRCHKHYDTDSN